MTLRVVSDADIKTAVASSNGNILVIGAPNYEPRSAFGFLRALNTFGVKPGDVKVALVTLQAVHRRVEPLEQLKWHNVAAVQQTLREGGFEFAHDTIPYPEDFTSNIVDSKLRMLTDRVHPPFDIVIDITALPRRFLISLVKVVRSWGTKVGHAFLIYTQAGRYPQPRYPAEVGSLQCFSSQLSLAEFLKKHPNIHAALLIGRQGFDAKLVLDTLQGSMQVNVYAFINRDDPLHSFDVMRANEPVLSDNRVNVQYVLSHQAGIDRLSEWAETCPIQPNTGLLVAPFGPKPLVVASALARDHLEVRCRGTEGAAADIVLLSSHHYGNMYSTGYGRTLFFSIDLAETNRDTPGT